MRSATVFYAWELGKANGHAGTFSPLAASLLAQGYSLVAAVRDLKTGATLLPSGIRLLQAPYAEEKPFAQAPLNYADILRRFGFDDPASLTSQVSAWRQLLLSSGAQLVIADHAPSAILAARTLDLPVMLFGSGFFCPPPVHPSPSWRSWEHHPAEFLLPIDQQVIETVNQVLACFSLPPIQQVSDLFAVAESAILCYPELDHFPGRTAARYWGGIYRWPTAHCPEWPQSKTGKRVFAYLWPDHPAFMALIRMLAESSHSVLLYAPNVRFESLPGNVCHSRLPVDLAAIAAEADVAVLYGGIATVTAVLMAGTPVFCVPIHLEQHLIGLRVEGLGAGLVAPPRLANDQLGSLFSRVLHEPAFTESAQHFARKYADSSQAQVIEKMVEKVSVLLAC